jgi:predicted DNA-binding protein (MmcQ/YjbR family)
MTLDELKRYLRSKPGATEGTPFGPEHLVYKVMGKIFAVVGWDEEPVTMSLKCDPEGVEVLRKVFRAVTPAPYFDKRYWNLVVLDGSIPEPELLAMVDASYDLVVDGLTRARREELRRLGRTAPRSRKA